MYTEYLVRLARYTLSNIYYMYILMIAIIMCIQPVTVIHKGDIAKTPRKSRVAVVKVRN